MRKESAVPLIIAHRGASALAPENTLAAFQKAIDDGAEGIEFDVRLAADGIPVVFHDADLKRLGNRSASVASVASADLQQLDVGSWFNRENPDLADGRFAFEKIPTLEHLFKFLNGYRGRLYVELKCGSDDYPNLVKSVCETIRETDFVPQIVVKSFELAAVALTKQLFPEIITASLFTLKIRNVINKRRHLLTEAARVRSDEISLHYSLATKKLVKRAGDRGLPVTIWTVDHPRWVKRAATLGIKAIITNDPARLLAQRLVVLNKKS